MLKKRYIGNNWPAPKVSVLPENVQWHNMPFSDLTRYVRRFVIGIFILSILVGSFYAIVTVQGLKKE